MERDTDFRQEEILRLSDELRQAYADRWKMLREAEESTRGKQVQYSEEWRAYHEQVSKLCRISAELQKIAAGDHYEGPRI